MREIKGLAWQAMDGLNHSQAEQGHDAAAQVYVAYAPKNSKTSVKIGGKAIMNMGPYYLTPQPMQVAPGLDAWLHFISGILMMGLLLS